MPDPSFLQRLKERKLVQWGMAYLAVAVVVVGVLEAVAEPWQIPTRVEQSIHVLLILGFSITLVLAWYHGEKGSQRVSGGELAMLVGLVTVAGVSLATLGGEEPPQEPVSFVMEVDPRPRIAVLPLRNQSLDPEDDFFAGNLQEGLTSGLTRIPSLLVIPRFSVERYRDPIIRPPLPELADLLGADYLLEGAAGIVGDGVRITMQLVSGATGYSLWTNDLDEPWSPEDYGRVVANLVQRVASQLRAEILPEDLEWLRVVPTQNLEAFEAYMQGKEQARREGALMVTWENYSSIPFFEQAIELDPEFSLALAGLASAGLRASYSAEWVADSVRRIARRALAITPDLPEARLALARALSALGREEDARAQFQALEETALHDPEIAMAVALHRGDHGDLNYEIETFERLERLYPRDPGMPNALSGSYILAHRYDDALEAMDRRNALVGRRGFGTRLETAYIHLARGERLPADAAISELLQDMPELLYGLPPLKSQRVFERLLRPEQRQAAYEAALASGHLDDEVSGFGFSAISAAIHAAAMGRTEEARAHWDSARVQLEGAPPSSDAPLIRVMDHFTGLTLIYQGLGEKEASISTARRLVEDPGGSDCRFIVSFEECALLARVYAHFGEHNAAIDLLEVLLPTPSRLTVHILQFDPIWEPLHGHPRFQALLAEYADDVEHD